MISKRHFIFLILFFFSCQFCFAQTKETEKDSLEMYRNIENYSRKRGITKFLHKLIFEPVVAKQNIKKNTFQKIKKKTFVNLEGKIIRQIKIQTLDPFGFSELDTTKKPDRWSYRVGNAIHNKTSNLAIRNFLLIKRNKPLDTLLLKESERLIRTQRYVRAVKMDVSLTSKNSDSVDVYIRVLDSWSLIPDFQASTSRMTFKLNERNFMGTGHRFENTYRKSVSTNQNAYSTLYNIPNIMNTYINTTLSYDIDINDNYRKFINIERPFFSPFTRWAAGSFFSQDFRREPQYDSNGGVASYHHYKNYTQDYWAGHSYQIFKGTSEKSRTTNLVTSLRYLHSKYTETPPLSADTLRIFSGQDLYMVGIGISSRQFVQDKYLFNYQVVEDVPTGLVYGLTGGYQHKNSRQRYYLGGRFSIGKYFKFGYLSTNIEYGTFYKDSKAEQSATVCKIIYFTNLVETKRWKFRQFIKPELVIGNSRLLSDADRLTLNEDAGIQGFNSTSLFGTKKLLVTFQTQGYSPWNVVGFRFNPYIRCTFGMLGLQDRSLLQSRMYTQFGGGFIISNDYLVFSTFQLSFAYYPSIPGQGTNVLKTNALNTEDFGLQTFDFSKPQLVSYQ